MHNLKQKYNALANNELNQFSQFLIIELNKNFDTPLFQQLLDCLAKEDFASVSKILKSAFTGLSNHQLLLIKMHLIYKKLHNATTAEIEKQVDKLLQNFESASQQQREINAEKKAFIEQLKTELNELFKKYVVEELIKNEDLSPKLKLLQFYRERGLKEGYEALYVSISPLKACKNKQDLDELFAKNFYNQTFFKNLPLIEQDYQVYYNTHVDKGTDDIRFGIINYLYDVQYIINKLSVVCALFNRKRMANLAQFDDDIHLILEGKSYKEIPIVAIWYNSYQLLKNLQEDPHKNEPNKESVYSRNAKNHYDLLSELLLKYLNNDNKNQSIEPEFANLFYHYLINTSTDFFSGLQLQMERFKLYKALFTTLNKHYPKSKQAENGAKENIIYIDSAVGSCELIFKSIYTLMEFLLEYQDDNYCDLVINESDINEFFDINEHIKNENLFIYNYCKAEYLFSRKKIEDAKELLPSISDAKRVLHKLDVKRLELKLEYQIGNPKHKNMETQKSVFQSMVDAFYAFFTNNPKISKKHKTPNSKFLKCTNDLYKIRNEINDIIEALAKEKSERKKKALAKKKAVLKNKVEELYLKIKQDTVPGKFWLLEKCKELLNMLL